MWFLLVFLAQCTLSSWPSRCLRRLLVLNDLGFLPLRETFLQVKHTALALSSNRFLFYRVICACPFASHCLMQCYAYVHISVWVKCYEPIPIVLILSYLAPMSVLVHHYFYDTEVSIIWASISCVKVFRYNVLLSLKVTKLNSIQMY